MAPGLKPSIAGNFLYNAVQIDGTVFNHMAGVKHLILQ
jgi:hypothetical protein